MDKVDCAVKVERAASTFRGQLYVPDVILQKYTQRPAERLDDTLAFTLKIKQTNSMTFSPQANYTD
jgi:hypothetical protein